MKHIHHIIPKHVTNGVANNHPDNLWVCDNVAEHAELHKQRFLMYRDWQDECAWLGLSGQIGHEDAINMVYKHSVFNNSVMQTEFAKRAAIARKNSPNCTREKSAERMRKARRRKHWFTAKGENHPSKKPEVAAKISASKTGKKRSPESVEKQRQTMLRNFAAKKNQNG